MTRIICIINQKGGVGKTTTAISLAAGLSSAGKKVLVIDLDAQGNIAPSLNLTFQKGIYELLLENALASDCITRVNDNFHVIPSKETLTKAELVLVGEQGRETYLKRKLQYVNGYDFIFIDCPPSLGLLNQNAMMYADEAIIPTSTDILGVKATQKMLAAFQKIKEVFNHEIAVTHIIPTLYDSRNKVCKHALAYLIENYPSVVTAPIRINSKIKETPGVGKHIFDYDPASNAAKDYQAVINRLLGKTQEQAVQLSEPEVPTVV